MESSRRYGAMFFCLYIEFGFFQFMLNVGVAMLMVGVVVCLTEVKSSTNLELINCSYEFDLVIFSSMNFPSPCELLLRNHGLST